jgi:hypothetical protein
MFVWDLLVALIIAILLASILVFALGRPGPGPVSGFIFFLVLLFLAIWAGGIWITPVGPVVYDVPWLLFLVIGIIIALLLAAVAPPAEARPVTPAEIEEEREAAEATLVAFSAFFWIVVIVMIVSIVAYYIWGPFAVVT